MSHQNRHPLGEVFHLTLDQVVREHVDSQGRPAALDYLTELLLQFMRTEQLLRIRDAEGNPVETITELKAEGDVRLRADSFERERQVHKHIGDTILFWSGVFPDHLRRVRLANLEVHCDYRQQGRASYHLVSTYTHEPYDQVAPVFEELSEEFDTYVWVLKEAARRIPIYAA